MKLFLLAGAIFACLPGAMLQGQETPSPQRETRAPAEKSATPATQLIPADVLALPKTGDLPSLPPLDDAFKASPVSAAVETQRWHLEWRRLRNEVQNDREIKAALQTAEAAGTDLEKRKLLMRYYELFYRKMTARAAPEMKGYLADRKKDAMQTLPQPRVRPRAIIASTPSTLAAPSPTPSIAPPPAEPLPAIAPDPLTSPTDFGR